LGSEAESAVEGEGRGVALPGVEGDVVAPFLTGKGFHVIKQGRADMTTTGRFVHTEVVDVKRGEGHETS